MKVRIMFLGELRNLTGKKEVEIEANENETVRDLLKEVGEVFGEKISKRIFDENGELSDNVRVLVNGRNILIGKGLETKLCDGDSVILMPPLAGGSFA
jgi:MoaD family protein